MKTHSVILYSQTSPSPDHTPVHLHQVTGNKHIYVRAEVVEGTLDEALLKAEPREGETVLNTIDL